MTYCQFDGLLQGRHNSSALKMGLRLSCTNPSNWSCINNLELYAYQNKKNHRKMYFQVLSEKELQFCLGLNVLREMNVSESHLHSSMNEMILRNDVALWNPNHSGENKLISIEYENNHDNNNNKGQIRWNASTFTHSIPNYSVQVAVPCKHVCCTSYLLQLYST